MPIDSHELYELELLKHVENDHQVTNRLVAQKLNVSVRLAHDILTRMVQKGLLHVTVVNSRRWDYFLTPKGIKEKARLTFEYLDFSLYFYREARKRSAQVCRQLSEQNITEVGFIGCGDLAEIAYLGVQEWHLHLRNVFDDDHGKKEFLHIPIQPLDEVQSSRLPALIVCTYDAKNPMRERYLPPKLRQKSQFHWIF